MPMRRMATAMNRRLHSLLCHSGDWLERSAPQIANRPKVLPKRNDERQDAARNQREPQIFGRGRKIGGAGAGELLQVVKYWTIAKPKPISATAVRCHDIIVRSTLRRVRIQPK